MPLPPVISYGPESIRINILLLYNELKLLNCNNINKNDNIFVNDLNLRYKNQQTQGFCVYALFNKSKFS